MPEARQGAEAGRPGRPAAAHPAEAGCQAGPLLVDTRELADHGIEPVGPHRRVILSQVDEDEDRDGDTMPKLS